MIRRLDALGPCRDLVDALWTDPVSSTAFMKDPEVFYQRLDIAFTKKDRLVFGVFQGADVSMFNRWRSERISCMIDNRFYFSTWQRMLIVQRIMTLSGSTFDVESFWANDVTTDPVRDTNVSSVMGDMSLPAQIMPPLPEPVLTVVE